jgi:hypothetical protein
MTKLEEFLRKERVLTKFKKNICNKACHGAMYDLKDGDKIYQSIDDYFMEYGDSRMGITGAFLFSSAPEGGDYWYDIDVKYQQIKFE